MKLDVRAMKCLKMMNDLIEEYRNELRLPWDSIVYKQQNREAIKAISACKVIIRESFKENSK
jgi:hypothetical protein